MNIDKYGSLTLTESEYYEIGVSARENNTNILTAFEKFLLANKVTLNKVTDISIDFNLIKNKDILETYSHIVCSLINKRI